MFTGIVEAVGLLEEVEELETTRRFRVQVGFAGELALGDSVAVDGACLTVVEHDDDGFAVDVIGTTLVRTIAARYAAGSRINLERAVRVGDRLDGHIVQGHVDGIGTVVALQEDGEFWRLDVRLPPVVRGHTVPRGSITVNGVSLTVANFVDDEVCRIGLIPYTFEHTNLGGLAPGDPVNLEGDLIGKYVGRMLADRETTGPR